MSYISKPLTKTELITAVEIESQITELEKSVHSMSRKWDYKVVKKNSEFEKNDYRIKINSTLFKNIARVLLNLVHIIAQDIYKVLPGTAKKSDVKKIQFQLDGLETKIKTQPEIVDVKKVVKICEKLLTKYVNRNDPDFLSLINSLHRLRTISNPSI